MNLNNPYDLDVFLFLILISFNFHFQNYLHHKGITISDFVRAFYFELWLILGLSNLYRYEHFVRKSDFWYSYEKIKIGLNVQGKEQKKQTLNYLLVFKYLNDYFIGLLDSSDEKK